MFISAATFDILTWRSVETNSLLEPALSRGNSVFLLLHLIQLGSSKAGAHSNLTNTTPANHGQDEGCAGIHNMEEGRDRLGRVLFS